MLGIGCPDRHALLRITSPKLRRPRRLLPSRERVRSSARVARSDLFRRRSSFSSHSSPSASTAGTHAPWLPSISGSMIAGMGGEATIRSAAKTVGKIGGDTRLEGGERQNEIPLYREDLVDVRGGEGAHAGLLTAGLWRAHDIARDRDLGTGGAQH